MERTIINVKGMPTFAWEQAKRASKKRGETMGEWLGRACIAQANREANDGIILPGRAANPPPQPALIPVDLREVAAVLAAMGSAGVAVQKRVGAKVNALLYGQLRAAEPAQGALRIGRDDDA